jgi:hypothetical protein
MNQVAMVAPACHSKVSGLSRNKSAVAEEEPSSSCVCASVGCPTDELLFWLRRRE